MRCSRLVVGFVVLSALVPATLVGCGPRSIVKDPSAITLKSALTEVGEGLAAMVKAQPASTDFGVYPAEVVVSFNVAASGTGSGTLLVTPGLPDITPAVERTGLKASVSETATRANTVTVKFINVLFAPPDALVQHVTGPQLFELRQAMLGIDPRSVMVPVQMDTTAAKPAAAAQAAPTDKASIPSAAKSGEAAQPAPVQTRASLPAMKFMSPTDAENDASTYIKSLPADRLAPLARALNARVGLEVVRPDGDADALRERLVDSAARLTLKRADLESMVSGGR